MLATAATAEPPHASPALRSVGPFRLPLWLLVVGFFLAALGGLMDYAIAELPVYTGDAHRWFAYGWLALLLFADREGPLRPRLKLAGLGLLATLILLYLFHDHADRHGRRWVLGVLLRDPSLYCWLATLWLAAPVFLRRGAAPLPVHESLYRAALALMLLYGMLQFASSASSLHPQDSLLWFHRERSFLFALVFAWLRAARADERLRAATARGVCWTVALTLALAMLLALLDRFGGEAIRRWMAYNALVYLDYPNAQQHNPARRFIFPMLHFNRTAFYGLMALAFMAAASFSPARRGVERFAPCFIPLAFMLILLSFTRGVVAASVAGLLLWCVLGTRRALVPAALLLAGVIAVMPAQRRQYLMTMFDSATYAPGAGTQFTSMHARVHGWRWGLAQVAEAPLTGLGYGPAIVRDKYRDYVLKNGPQRLIEDIESGNQLMHMHNQWLETAAESGIPAAVALLAFTVCRWVLLARWWRRDHAAGRLRAAVWLSLEFSLLIAGMVFYMLKSNFGFIFFFAWAWALLDALRRLEALAPSSPLADPTT